MGPADINYVAVAIPDNFNSSEGMIPTEVHSPNARPVRREITVIDGNLRLLDRKYSATPQDRNALCPGFQFMRGITGNNGFLFVVDVVINVIDRHHHLMPVV